MGNQFHFPTFGIQMDRTAPQEECREEEESIEESGEDDEGQAGPEGDGGEDDVGLAGPEVDGGGDDVGPSGPEGDG